MKKRLWFLATGVQSLSNPANIVDLIIIKVVRTRPLYPYPTVARYKGSGDIDEAVNWKPIDPPVVHDDDIKWVWDPD